MDFNFDEPINRKGTCCVKHDLIKEVFGRDDIIPLWVADMDFKAPEFIINKLAERVSHGVFGYSFRDEEYHDAIIGWMKRRHDWKITKESICFSPGIVPALNFCTMAFTNPGDSIIIQTPVYPPFFGAVKNHNRNLICNPLVEKDNMWVMDLEALEASITPSTKMFILCNPHNPVGRVWAKDELEKLGDICLKHNIIIVSDDIHCDLLLPGYRHVPIGSISDALENISVTCIAPSKTFNVAGLATSAIIIQNKDLRDKFLNITCQLHVTDGNLFGNIASTEAFKHGDKWLDTLMNYIKGNEQFVINFLKERIPEIVPVQHQATFLLWLNCKKLGMNGRELQKFFVEKARVGMNEGSEYGSDGEGFMRMNIGTQRSVLQEALIRIEKAIISLSDK